MEKKDILKTLIKHYANDNQTRFANMLGIKPQTITSWLSRDTFDADLIYAKCVNISGDYLLSGDGPMLRNVEMADHIPDAGKMISTDKDDTDEQPDNGLTAFLQQENARLHTRITELERQNAVLSYRLEQMQDDK